MSWQSHDLNTCTVNISDENANCKESTNFPKTSFLLAQGFGMRLPPLGHSKHTCTSCFPLWVWLQFSSLCMGQAIINFFYDKLQVGGNITLTFPVERVM